MRHSAGGHEFNANESTIDIKEGIFKQKHTWNQGIYLSVKILWLEIWRNLTLYFPLQVRGLKFSNLMFLVT